MDIKTVSTPVSGNSALQSDIKPAVGAVKAEQVAASVVTPTMKVEQKQETLEKVAQVNEQLEMLSTGLSFFVDESTQASVIKVIDKTTDEVIKQFPNEGSLAMIKNIQSYLDSVQQNGQRNKEGLTGTLINEII